MNNEYYTILAVRLTGIELATALSFNHEFEAKDWINENGVKGISYMIQKVYKK